MADKRRTQLSLDKQVCDALERIALEHDLRLSPPHAARAGRMGDWAGAIEALVQSNAAIYSVLGEMADFVDEALRYHGASCRYQNGEMTIQLGGKVYTRKLS